MHPVAIAVIFFLIWWLVFFAVLPTGVKSEWETESAGEKVAGADPGAPVDPQIRKKMIKTTLIAAIITAAVCALIMSGLINFRE